MAKKKVKTKASLLAASAAASANESIVYGKERDHNHGHVVQPNLSRSDRVEILTARLKTAVGKSSSLHKQSRVILTSNDALQLDVSVGDDVIILSFDDNLEKKTNLASEIVHLNSSRRVKALAVLPIEIYSDKPTSEMGSNNHIASPMILRKKVSQQQWNPGTIQITSLSVLEKFTSSSLPISSPLSINKHMSEMSLTEKDVTSTLSTPSVVTPKSQPSTTPFSFKTMVSTPSSNVYRTPGSSSTTKSKLQTDHNRKEFFSVKVIPCRTKLGQFILQSRTSRCTNITIVPVFDSSSCVNQINDNTTPIDASSMNQITSSAVRTLERLVHAHLLDSYVIIGQQFRISFTGKPFHFKILDATNVEEPQNDSDPAVQANCINESLDETFLRLNMQDSETANDSNGDMKELYSSILNSNIRLHHILRSTHISISYKKQSNETIETDAMVPHNTVADSLPKSNQYVAGLSTTLDELRSLLLAPLQRPELFTSRGMKIPRGVLLHGPNGVGKTCLAKQFLFEIENQLHCRTKYVHCASLQSKSDIVGEAEAALSNLFRATKNMPMLLVLDDIHLICSKRGGGGSSQGMDRLAATLLALMDGIEGNDHSSSAKSSSPGNVVILAVTTNPSILDPALRRPGRLDAEIEVPLPEDASSRAEIIQFHVTNFDIELAEDLKQQDDFLDVAKAAKGFNGADCMLAVKEAIRLAILESNNAGTLPILQRHHLLAAMRSTKPSAIKSITVEIPQVFWSSIGGMDSVKRDLREAIELPLSHNEYFEQLRVPPPRGILLYGPPGCSKTLMARALATEGNINFLAVKGPELLSKWLGESERALSSLFRRARMASPAIVFFDEIDAIASKRGSGDSASSGRLLSQLLTELDGVNHTGTAVGGGKTKHHRIVVVGATNRPDLLDTALTRPGRIDRMIYVGPPDAASRAQILRLTLQKSCCSTDIDISLLADDNTTGGFSGAEMVAICRDAALLALEEEEGANEGTTTPAAPMIEMRHLRMAIQSMPRQITPSMIDFYNSYQEKVTVI